MIDLDALCTYLFGPGTVNKYVLLVTLIMSPYCLGFIHAYMFTISIPLWSALLMWKLGLFLEVFVQPLLAAHLGNHVISFLSSVVELQKKQIAHNMRRIELLNSELEAAEEREAELERQLHEPGHFEAILFPDGREFVVGEDENSESSSDTSFEDEQRLVQLLTSRMDE
jgi:hypothetical protein